MNRMVASFLVKVILPKLLERFQGNQQPEYDVDSYATGDEGSALDTLLSKSGAVSVIIGRRGLGKTSLALRIAEARAKPVFIVSPNARVPSWVNKIGFGNINENTVPGGSTLILDDVATYMSNRDYSDSIVKETERMIPMVRHWDNEKGLFLIVCTQNAGIVNKHVLDTDALFIKQLSILYEDVERAGVQKFISELNRFLMDNQKNGYNDILF